MGALIVSSNDEGIYALYLKRIVMKVKEHDKDSSFQIKELFKAVASYAVSGMNLRPVRA